MQISTLTSAQRAEEQYFADCAWRGITPDPTRIADFQPADQCQGKPLPQSARRVRLSHHWWVGATTLVVEPCPTQQGCRVCDPAHADHDLYGIVQS
jgi:hypothetical protein